MPERPVPTKDEVLSYLRDRRNWGRWGEEDQKGAINLITPEKRVAAAGLVRSGRVVSISRDFPKTPGPNNPNPAQHFVQVIGHSGTPGGATDYYGISYHGYQATHIDALCHVWDEHGMWNGRDPYREIRSYGARFGGVENWREGIITRGVLLDITRLRGAPFVTVARPVHGWELEDAASSQGVKLEPGDALLVYSGREAWQADNPDWTLAMGSEQPGLHASCLPFLRDRDIALLGWDLMDASPNEYGMMLTVHGALHAYGVALLDNCLLQPLAEACATEGRYEFMLTVAPLPVVGGTGSPVNPLALF